MTQSEFNRQLVDTLVNFTDVMLELAQAVANKSIDLDGVNRKIIDLKDRAVYLERNEIIVPDNTPTEE